MSAKIKLDVLPYANISVIAVCAPMRDYRFIWHLNNHLSVTFAQDVPFSWPHKKLKQTFDYAVFRCPENSNIMFINNRNENAQLISTLPSIDYFVVFSESPSEAEVKKWITEIKSISGITLLTMLTEKHIDEFRQILSEMEFQEMRRTIAERGKSRGY